MDNNEMLLRQLEGFESRVNAKFDKVDARFDKVEFKIDALGARTDVVERDLLVGKTAGGIFMALGSTVGAAVGWDHIKPWLTFLTR